MIPGASSLGLHSWDTTPVALSLGAGRPSPVDPPRQAGAQAGWRAQCAIAHCQGRGMLAGRQFPRQAAGTELNQAESRAVDF